MVLQISLSDLLYLKIHLTISQPDSNLSIWYLSSCDEDAVVQNTTVRLLGPFAVAFPW